MMRVLRFALPLIALLIIAIGIVAQTPATTATASSTATTATTATGVQQTLEQILEEPTTGDTYRYDPQGRRDPFRSLIGPAPKLQAGTRPPGVPGFLIDEM